MSRIAVLVFPGSNCDGDCLKAVEMTLDRKAQLVWHTERNLDGFEAVILPGGFSYGDYLRAGALARFAPVMQEVVRQADRGVPVVGICNGFQILLEAGLLPGAMRRNRELKFVCADVTLRVENNRTPFTWNYRVGEEVVFPVAHGEGNYYCDEETLRRLEGEGRIVFRYVKENPNGSVADIAGIANAQGNVVGLMPHPERAVDPLTGLTDGRRFFASLLQYTGERLLV